MHTYIKLLYTVHIPLYVYYMGLGRCNASSMLCSFCRARESINTRAAVFESILVGKGRGWYSCNLASLCHTQGADVG